MNIVSELKRNQTRAKNLEFEIEKNSMYNFNDIGEVLSKLLSEMDNTPYTFINNPSQTFQYYIHSEKVDYPIRHNLNYLRHIEFILEWYGLDFCFLPPSDYCDMVHKPKENDTVQKFLDYVFNKRIEEHKHYITKKNLDDYLKTYMVIQEYKKVFHF